MGVKPSKYSDRHPGGDAQRMNGDGMRVRQGFKAAVGDGARGDGWLRPSSCRRRRSRRSDRRAAPGRDVELHHGRDDLDPDGDAGVELRLADLRREGVLRLHQRAGRRERPQDRLQVRPRRRRQPHDVQPAGQHADQPGPRVRRDRRGDGVLLAEPLRRGGHPDLRLQRDRQLGRPAEPLRRRRVGASTTRPGRRRCVRGAEDADQALHRVRRLQRRGVRRRLPGGAGRDAGRRLQRQLLGLQGELPGHDGGDRRAAHEAGRLQHGRQLHGRAGQRHDGPGDPAVRAEDDPAVVQRQRPADARPRTRA